MTATVEYRAQHIGAPGVTVLTTIVDGQVPRVGDNICLVDGWASEGVQSVDLLVYSDTWIVTIRLRPQHAEELRDELARR